MITQTQLSTTTLTLVRPTAAPCFWCGYKRTDHFGNASWADTQLRCPRPVARMSLGERLVSEPTYQAVGHTYS
jgi:hypothetical protein